MNKQDKETPKPKQKMRTATHQHTPKKDLKAWQQARSTRDVTDGNGRIVVRHLG